MRYKNVKTGAIVNSPFKIVGKNWVETTDEESEGIQQKQETKEEYVEEEIDLEAMTKSELIDLAKEHEIDVDEKATKAVIIETIAKAFE